jgi:hypothetical protein
MRRKETRFDHEVDTFYYVKYARVSTDEQRDRT